MCRSSPPALPRYARVLVVSRGDDHLVDLVGRRASHFPQARDGAYAGHHPADSDAAINHLEELREAGAQYLVSPAPRCGGWFRQFHEHLQRRYRCIVHEPVCRLHWRKRSSHETRQAGLPLSELNVEGPNGTTVEFFGSTGSRATPSSASTRDTPPRASPSSSRARKIHLRLRGPARGGRRSREGHRPYEWIEHPNSADHGLLQLEPRQAPCRAWGADLRLRLHRRGPPWMLDALAFLLVDRLLRCRRIRGLRRLLLDLAAPPR